MTTAKAPKAPTYSVYTLAWSNPSKPRPDGFPAVMLQIRTEMPPGQGARCPAEMTEAWEEMHPYGYAVHWHQEGPPPRTLPMESKQRIRRRNLWKRMLKKYPLFLETFYHDAVVARPEYYGAFVEAEFADLVFYRTTQGFLKQLKEKAATR